MATTCTPVKLTLAAAIAAKPTADGKAKLYLDSTAGLGLLVGKKTKTFVIRTKNQKVSIGRFDPNAESLPDSALAMAVNRKRPLTVADAKKIAQQELARIARSGDPARITLSEALEEWALTAAPTTVDTARKLLRHLDAWMNLPLIKIDRAMIRTRHREIAPEIAKTPAARKRGNDGKRSANGAMIHFATIWHYVAAENEAFPECPTIALKGKWHTFDKAEGAIENLAAWLAEVNADENVVRRDYFKLCLHTGLRFNSAANLEWDDVDFDNRILKIRIAKGDKPFELPLTDYLVDLLKARKAAHDIDTAGAPLKMRKHVFPAHSASGHIVYARVKGAEWSPHDLRRTFLSRAAGAGVGPYVLKTLANHALKGGVTEGYIDVPLPDLRAGMEKISTALLKATGEQL